MKLDWRVDEAGRANIHAAGVGADGYVLGS
jgi:hypothetical protein